MNRDSSNSKTGDLADEEPMADENQNLSPSGVKKSPWALALSALALGGWLIWLTQLAIRVGQ